MIGSRGSYPRNPRKYQGGWIDLAVAGVSSVLGARSARKARKAAQELERRSLELQEQQLGLAKRDAARADELHTHYRSVYMPRERQLVSDVFDNPITPEAEEAAAAADVRSAFNTARLADEQRMRSMGVNPASGAYRSLSLARGLEEAKAEGAARTRARGAVRDLNFARQTQVLGLGSPTASVPYANLASAGVGRVSSLADARANTALSYADTAAQDFGAALGDTLRTGLEWWNERRQKRQPAAAEG